MPVTETLVVRTPVATEIRRHERRWLGWINPMPLARGPLVARLGVGIIMFMHGLQKIGLFGGGGWSATIETFRTNLHIPAPLAALVILTELVGGACLIVGLAARFMACAVAIEMVVAALLVHVKNGFFLNWYNVAGQGHGFEMNLALIALASVVIIEGAGRWAIDTPIAHRAALSEAGPEVSVPMGR